MTIITLHYSLYKILISTSLTDDDVYFLAFNDLCYLSTYLLHFFQFFFSICLFVPDDADVFWIKPAVAKVRPLWCFGNVIRWRKWFA